MRLAPLGVSHETNVFASRTTGYDRFLATGIYAPSPGPRSLLWSR